MTKDDCRRNIRLYWWYVVFGEPLFWGAILTTTLQDLAHMSVPEIYYMEAAVLWLCVALDIPSGAFADVIGRKYSVIIGRVFLLASAVCFTFMRTPLDAWVANILWAIGFSLQSGADSALLYGTLDRRGGARLHKRIVGRALGARLLVLGIGSLLAGALASIHLRLPLIVGLPFMCVSLVIACLFVEPARTRRYSPIAQMRVLKEGIVFVFTSATVRWMVGFAALLGAVSKVWFFSYNPYFETVQLPVVMYGVIFFLANMVAWLSSKHAHRLEEKIGEHTCVVGMILCLGIPITLMGLVPLQALAFFVLIQNVVRGFTVPFISDYMNRHITTDEIRATALSVQSTANNVACIVGLTLFGLSNKIMPLTDSLIVLGVSSLTLGAISYWVYRTKIML